MNQDLNAWHICDPQNAEDPLPMPYRMIDQVLNETILFQLNLELYHIEQKRKNSNYQGQVKQYLAHNTMDVEGISCFSTKTKLHNHLLAGDKLGNVYILDPAKNSIFSKKQIIPGHRIQHIAQYIISDGQTQITTAAIIGNNYQNVVVLRYSHSELKLHIQYEIKLGDGNNLGDFPYESQLEDMGRLLIVKSYNGNISAYRIPQLSMNVEQHIKKSLSSLTEQQAKKSLKYPLKYFIIETPEKPISISQKCFNIPFAGHQIPPTYAQLLKRIKDKKPKIVQQAQPAKKDTKKQAKKGNEAPPQQPQAQQKKIQFNQIPEKIENEIENGKDSTKSYPLPKYQPFVYILYAPQELPRTKHFQKGVWFRTISKILYGWTNTKDFYLAQIGKPSINCISEFIYIGHFMQSLPQSIKTEKSKIMGQNIPIQLKNQHKLSNIYEITCVELSLPDQIFFGCGMKDGTTAVWNLNNQIIQMTTDKHQLPVTKVKFFQTWKIITGSSKGEIHIDNIVTNANEVKRTNIFESKTNLPITNLEVSELGIAFALDIGGNLRAYDLWRNQKISKINPCNAFATFQGKGKRWLSSGNIQPNQTLYTNRDFTIILSNKWPNVPNREQDISPQLAEKIVMYKNNPWKCQENNVHVIRNFDFLLTLFQGLENTYKKGYQRRKIQHLFSNLEFSQLYDRTFDIPDFQRTVHKKSPRNNESSVGRSSLASVNSQKNNKSSSKSKLTQQQSFLNAPTKLTKQVLHPQKFLLQRRVIKKRQFINEQNLLQKIRAQHMKKQRRQTILNNEISKIGL